MHTDRNPNDRDRCLHEWRQLVGRFRRSCPRLLPASRGAGPGEWHLYITYSNGAGPYDGTMGDVQKYNTATGVWTEIAPVVPTTASGADYFGYGGLTIDKEVPTTIMVSAFNSWWPDTIHLAQHQFRRHLVPDLELDELSQPQLYVHAERLGRALGE
jgi:hypothetical protein